VIPCAEKTVTAAARVAVNADNTTGEGSVPRMKEWKSFRGTRKNWKRSWKQ